MMDSEEWGTLPRVMFLRLYAGSFSRSFNPVGVFSL